jgi:hypothetical protein
MMCREVDAWQFYTHLTVRDGLTMQMGILWRRCPLFHLMQPGKGGGQIVE